MSRKAMEFVTLALLITANALVTGSLATFSVMVYRSTRPEATSDERNLMQRWSVATARLSPRSI